MSVTICRIMFFLILASLVEAYYLIRSNESDIKDKICYILLCLFCVPFIPIIVCCIISFTSLKEVWEEAIKPYWFELSVYISLLIMPIIW